MEKHCQRYCFDCVLQVRLTHSRIVDKDSGTWAELLRKLSILGIRRRILRKKVDVVWKYVTPLAPLSIVLCRRATFNNSTEIDELYQNVSVYFNWSYSTKVRYAVPLLQLTCAWLSWWQTVVLTEKFCCNFLKLGQYLSWNINADSTMFNVDFKSLNQMNEAVRCFQDSRYKITTYMIFIRTPSFHPVIWNPFKMSI